jgi:hypothetical protein
MNFPDFPNLSGPKYSKCLSGNFFLLLIVIPSFVFAQKNSEPYKTFKVKHRINFGPVVSLYKNDPHHTINTKAKPGANVAYKAEILLGRKTNLLLGLEYESQGLIFSGYYKDTGYTYLFDKTFPYTHELRFNEVQLPVGLKLGLNREKEHPSTAYVFGGVGARYIFNSYSVITNDSTETSPYDGKSNIGFEHEFVAKGFNAFFYGGFGIQKNFRASAKAVFFEFNYKYGISRLHYSGYQNSNNLNIKNNSLAITVGFRI